RQIAKLRHRDTAESERRCIVAQCDPIQRAEGITRSQRARRGRDQRVHLNRATLVTLTLCSPALNVPHDDEAASHTENRNAKERPMNTHKTGTRQEWLAARLDLLKAEKEFTRRSDELAQQRQALPWVRIDKDYRFDTDEGRASLADLFRGRSQ